ncbi:MAG: hypothetical protein KDD36_13530 [Flavobacteriales bacterium]|nr:hypothetical protein [Flavobacteriales bacterium]
MQIIVAIIESMTPGELENVKKGLTQFATKRAKRPGPENSTSLKLVEAVLEHGDNFTDEDYCELMYGNKRDPRFRALKFWIKRRLLELQISDICLGHNQDLFIVYKYRIQVKKYLAQTFLYYAKGKGMRVLKFLFDQIIKIGKEYELFEELGEAYSLMVFTLNTGDPSIFDEIETKKSYYRKCQYAVDKASEIYNRRLLLEASQRNLPAHQEEMMLRNALEELDQISKEISSVKFNYFHLCLIYDYQLATRDVVQAEKTAKKLLTIVQKNRLVSNRNRTGKIYGYLCSCSLYLGNYHGVLKYAKKIKEYIKEGTSNMKLTLIHELQAQIYLSRYEDANETLKLLRIDPTYNDSERDISQYDYFHSTIHFLQGRYVECFRILQGVRDIMDDKAGWNIGVRQLSFMSLVEMGLRDQASAVVEQMRKYIERTKSKVEFRERDLIIYSLFAALNRADFDFDHSRSNMKKLMDRLSNDNDSIAWQPVSQEIVPVHIWFKEHQRMALSKRKKRKNVN